jgi:sec-independent protein translocase protein TatC
VASGQMTLRDHLEELRKRLIISVAAVILGFAVAFIFREQVLDFLLSPGFDRLPDTKPIFTEVTEMVAVVMKTSLMAAFVLALPVILYQLVMFVAPGLTRRERVYLFIFLPCTVAAFAGGVAFGYYVLFPPAFKFLFTFGTGNAEAAIRIGSYMNVVTSLLFWMGLVFELPLVMFFLARLGVVRARWLSRVRRFAFIIAFVMGAIITPTMDPVNQTMVALPIVVLYEIGILLAKVGERLRRRSPETTLGHQ